MKFCSLALCSFQVDEIMMTLKQAFTVAAVQQTSKAPPQLCEGCPMQSLHKLCEKIEGEVQIIFWSNIFFFNNFINGQYYL